MGAINRLYGRIARVIAAGKALKARNRRLYYVLKTGATVGLIALLMAPW